MRRGESMGVADEAWFSSNRERRGTCFQHCARLLSVSPSRARHGERAQARYLPLEENEERRGERERRKASEKKKRSPFSPVF